MQMQLKEFMSLQSYRDFLALNKQLVFINIGRTIWPKFLKIKRAMELGDF